MCGLNDVLTYSIAYGMGEEEGRAKAEREKKAGSNWHTGEPTRTDCLYLVLWFDTEDKAYQYSVLNWHNQLHCWFDEETPSCLWGDEWKAKVVAWMAFKPYEEKEDGR